jgi:hypothetical protein
VRHTGGAVVLVLTAGWQCQGLASGIWSVNERSKSNESQLAKASAVAF